MTSKGGKNRSRRSIGKDSWVNDSGSYILEGGAQIWTVYLDTTSNWIRSGFLSSISEMMIFEMKIYESKTLEGTLIVIKVPFRNSILDVVKKADFLPAHYFKGKDLDLIEDKLKKISSGDFILEFKEPDKYLNPYDEDIIGQIKERYLENKELEVEILDIVPLLERHDFLDLILEYKIPFISKINADVSLGLSDALLYISNKKSLGKGGNIFVGKQMGDIADNFAKDIGPLFDSMEEEGKKTLQAKAIALNDKGIKTPRGKEWSRGAVKNVLVRWQKLKAGEKRISKQSQSPKP